MLISRVTRGIFWNVISSPVIMVINWAASIVVVRFLGVPRYGVYAIILATVNTIVSYSGLGISESLPKFVPEVEKRFGKKGLFSFLKLTISLRSAALLILVILLNIFARGFSLRFGFGPSGILYIRLISLVVVLRSLTLFFYNILYSYFEQKIVNLTTALLQLIQPALVIWFVTAGLDITGILIAMTAANLIVSLIAGGYSINSVKKVEKEEEEEFKPKEIVKRFSLYSIFFYFYELSRYFISIDFAVFLIAIARVKEEVAYFSLGFKFVMMIIVFLVSSMRGVFRPLIGNVYASGDISKLRKTYDNLEKIQILLTIPAGVGLFILSPDLIPIFYKTDFLPAVPIARILTAFLFLETMLVGGTVILPIYERYKTVLLIRSFIFINIPVLYLIGSRHGIIAGAIALGSVRLLISIIENIACGLFFKVSFPYRFLIKTIGASAAFALVLIPLREVLGRSIKEVIILTLTGACIFLIMTKLLRIISEEEKTLIKKSGLPFREAICRLL
jgi:O-antigen/teichoic acid export membrane protein